MVLFRSSSLFLQKNLMNLHLKFDIPTACKKILQEQLDKFEITYTLMGFNEVQIIQPLSPETLQELHKSLNSYGIEIMETGKNILVQKIKDTVVEMVFVEEKLPTSTTSAYLAEKLNHSYGYLAKVFSDVTYTSIENFIILQRIERAKQLMATNELTLTEIAWKLNYSSVAHFCTQFKNVTGLTPSVFQRILSKKRTSA